MSIRTGLQWFSIIFLSMVVACSSSQNPEDDATQMTSLRKQWLTQKVEPIQIPENSGGIPALTRNFYFILDGSGSMGGQLSPSCGGKRFFEDKMAGARWAIMKFLRKIPEDVNIGLYIFDNHGRREAVPLNLNNRNSFLQAVKNISVGGGTPLAPAIRYATGQLVKKYKEQLGYGEFRLIVVTDGIASNIPEAAIYAAKFGIPIYAIGLCVAPNHPLRQFSVSYRAADNFEDLSKGLEATLAELPSFDTMAFE